MFETLELQNLNKLPERKVGDFTSPQAFHTVKVQRLGDDRIKPFTQVSSKFPMPIFALVGNMPIQSHKFSDSTPPIVRTFDFPRKAFVEIPKFFQGVSQGLRVFDFFHRCSASSRYPYRNLFLRSHL